MKPIATDTYTFSDLIAYENLYVDKTAIIWRLIHNPINGTKFFMSRPRRFGKSLLVSTLKAIFEGRRELFRGLAIDSMDYDWKVYPVLHFDMSIISDSKPEKIESNLFKQVLQKAKEVEGLEILSDDTASSLFDRLIKTLAKNHPAGKVVVLIDEYDAPVSGFFDEPTMLVAVRKLLHDFYVILKAHDSDIRFLFMTGVSKFTKLSVFSGLNNLKDISMKPEYATLLGFTPEELMSYHREHIQAFADKKGISFDAMVDELRAWYNGYRFSPESEATVLNPVSVGRALEDRNLRGHWSMTGGSSIIIERMKRANNIPADLNDVTATPDNLDVCDAVTLPMKALLYQGGYLTIKDVDEDGVLHLGIPNHEIREALDAGFINDMLKDAADDYLVGAIRTRRMFREQRLDAVWEMLMALFAKIPAEWRVKDEAELKRLFLLYFSLAGADIITEAQSARGRADAVVTTADTIYVIEFKYGQSSEAALAQIREKGYVAPFADSGKKIVCIGVNFNPETRTLDAPVME